MKRQRLTAALFTLLLFPFLRSVPALAAGDKVIPHVVDGVQDATTRYRTKMDISNLSPFLDTTITRVTVYFYLSNGSPWSITINDPVTKAPVTVSSYTLNLGYGQTVRIETTGTGAVNSGFAIVRNLEVPVGDPNKPTFHPEYYPDTREVSTTVYFEVLRGNDIMDTVSVPVAQPTKSFTFPVEIDVANGINTGFAIVNLAGGDNNVTLYLSQNKDPMSGNAGDAGNRTFKLDTSANKKKVDFLSGSDFFPSLTKFKGMAYCSSDGPVAVLSLLQSNSYFNGAWSGVQFATVTPAYLDSLRRNTLMYMTPGSVLDADLPVVDYFPTPTTDQGVPDSYYTIPWDVTLSSTTTGRFLTPEPGVLIAPLGGKTATDFDRVTLPDLIALTTYSSNAIDLGDRTGNFTGGFCFAIKTGLGQYVKVRIRTIVEYTSPVDNEMVLEMYVYK